MTNEELDRLQELSDKATPGPWELWTSNSNRRISGPDGVDGGVLYGITPKDGTSDLVGEPADLELIPAARNAMPDLIAAARRLNALEAMLLTIKPIHLTAARAEAVVSLDFESAMGIRQVQDEIRRMAVQPK